MSVKRTYSRTASPGKQRKRRGGYSSSQSLSQDAMSSSQLFDTLSQDFDRPQSESQSEDALGFLDSQGSDASQSPYPSLDFDDASASLDFEPRSKPRLNSLTYHKMSTGAHRKSSLQTKKSGHVRASMDELSFHLDGLASNDSHVRRLSAASIASLCASKEVRMYMRMSKGDAAASLLKALCQTVLLAQAKDKPKDCADADFLLSTGCILYFLSRDAANLEYFGNAEVKLLAVLLDSAAPVVPSRAVKKSPSKLGAVLGKKRRSGARPDDPVQQIKKLVAGKLLLEPTACNFALESLLAIADEQNVKDAFRETGVLDQLSKIIHQSMTQQQRKSKELPPALTPTSSDPPIPPCAYDFDLPPLADDEPVASSTEPLAAVASAQQCAVMPLCFKILEKVTFMSETNASYIVTNCSNLPAALLETLQNLMAASAEAAGDGSFEKDLFTASCTGGGGGGDDDGGGEMLSRGVIGVCLRVLVNLTNELPLGCQLVSKWRPSSKPAALAGTAGSPGSVSRRVNAKSSSRFGSPPSKIPRTKPTAADGNSAVASLPPLSTTPPQTAAVTAWQLSSGGGEGGGIEAVLGIAARCVWCGRGWNDVLIVSLALLINLAEDSAEYCAELAGCAVTAAARGRDGRRGGSSPVLSAIGFLIRLFETESVLASQQDGAKSESEAQEEAPDEAEEEMLVSAYAAVLLGLLALRVPAAHAELLRALASPPGVGAATARNSGLRVRLDALVRSIRSFGVVHAQAGVLEEQQARTFDQILANLSSSPQLD